MIRGDHDGNDRFPRGIPRPFYAAKAHHDRKQEGEYSLSKLFRSSDDIPERLLELWSQRVNSLDPEIVGDVLCLRARAVADGRAEYDHASDFLHALLRELNSKQH